MNRLQKKCFIATMGLHLLLVVVLLASSAFRAAPPEPAGDPVIIYPPSALPAEPPPDLPQPPVPAILPRTSVTPVDPVKPPKAPPHVVVPNLTGVVRPAPTQPEINSGGAMREPMADPYGVAIANLKKHFSTGTSVKLRDPDVKVDESYAILVRDKFQTAWNPPGDTASDDVSTRVSVTIRSDGTVIAARILDASGVAGMDGSVRRTLDRVTFVAPFPDGAKEKEKTFIINFNLKAKRNIG